MTSPDLKARTFALSAARDRITRILARNMLCTHARNVQLFPSKKTPEVLDTCVQSELHLWLSPTSKLKLPILCCVSADVHCNKMSDIYQAGRALLVPVPVRTASMKSRHASWPCLLPNLHPYSRHLFLYPQPCRPQGRSLAAGEAVVVYGKYNTQRANWWHGFGHPRDKCVHQEQMRQIVVRSKNRLLSTFQVLWSCLVLQYTTLASLMKTNVLHMMCCDFKFVSPPSSPTPRLLVYSCTGIFFITNRFCDKAWTVVLVTCFYKPATYTSSISPFSLSLLTSPTYPPLLWVCHNPTNMCTTYFRLGGVAQDGASRENLFMAAPTPSLVVPTQLQKPDALG